MNESNHDILDMRELEIILKPFLKNGLIELDHNNSEYHNISKELFLFLENVILNKKKIYPLYDKIFCYLIEHNHKNIHSNFWQYPRNYLKRNFVIFFEKTLSENNSKEEIFSKDFLELLEKKGGGINARKILDAKDIYKTKIISNQNFIELISNKTISLILNKTMISDIINEKIFTEIRKVILDGAVKNKNIINNEYYQNFISSLASNCFYNEYSWFESSKELKNISLLREKIQKNLDKNKKIILNEIFILASYRPLCEFKNIHKYFLDSGHPIIKEQILDFIIEDSFVDKVKSLSTIKNKVSLGVRSQYENYPYPRWKSLDQENRDKDKYINHVRAVTNSAIIEKNIKSVLVAGCGTGKHPVDIALTDPSLEIYAMDLSKRSLAYGMRKSAEMNLSNIKWVHGDILELKSIEKKFDLIESVGVLHHMENPKQAFDILSEILGPNGFMKIGLYAKSMRDTLKPAKDFIKKNKLSKDLKSIQKARKLISQNKEIEMVKPIVTSMDFYSSSQFIDFLMHEQELDFEINDLVRLYGFDYKFLGFEIHRDLKPRFDDLKKRIKVTENEFENWKSIEKIDPSFFSNMYQFWLQKK